MKKATEYLIVLGVLIATAVILVAVLLALKYADTGFGPPISTQPPSAPAQPSIDHSSPVERDHGPGAEPQAPNRKLTPGAVDPLATVAQVCQRGYTSGYRPGLPHVTANMVRHVTQATKTQVFAEYGLDPSQDMFEVDHLISLELGGSNDIKNLWPQSYTSMPYNAHIKDALEDRLHYLVCTTHELTLKQAQQAIATDWVAAYKKYVMN